MLIIIVLNSLGKRELSVYLLMRLSCALINFELALLLVLISISNYISNLI